MALLYEAGQFGQKVQWLSNVVFTPAGVSPEVTGGPIRVGLDEQRVVVAIVLYAHHVQIVA